LGPKSLPISGRTEKHLAPPDNRSKLLHLVTITDYAIQPTISSIGTSDTLTSLKLSLTFLGGSTEELKKMLDINVLAVSVCTIQAVQSMKERGVDDGHIIHINRLDSL
jgi:short-subunit dehydrogenase